MSLVDHYVPGNWNAICDRCGRKFKANQLRRTWEGYMVCDRDWEPRHPQDYVKGVKEAPNVPFVRRPADVAIEACTLRGRQSVAGWGVAGCMVAGRFDGISF